MNELPLRTFLTMRSDDDGRWAVTVARDLGAVMRTWKGRADPGSDVGVLHVGFDRPPTRVFERIAAVNPGRMLLTAAAKHALPNSFKSSAAPIGAVDDTEVFLGLRGWGYSLEDHREASHLEGQAGSPLEDSATGSGRLLTEMRRLLSSFSDRDRAIVVRRMGFEAATETLEHIAGDYDVSRERIRQLEVRTRKWIREADLAKTLERKIERLIGRSGPLPVAGVEAADSWFEGMGSRLEFFKRLVQAVCGERIHFVEIDDCSYFSLMDQKMWQRKVAEAAKSLSSGAGQGWSEEYTRSLVEASLPNTAREFGRLLWDEASRLCHFSTDADGSRVFTSYGRGVEPLVKVILAESDAPLHYSEITRRVGLKKGTRVEGRRPHHVAAEIAHLFALGTYGLDRHLPLSDEEMSRIREEAEDIVCSGAFDRQWHTTEILSELSGRLDGGVEKLDRYLLDIALKKSERLRSLGRMTWVEARDDTEDGTRIDIREAVISIIEEAGHPLSFDEIKERLTAERGVSEFFNIVPIDPLVRMRRGVWGVNDRDVPLSREEQANLVEELARILEERQRGIHVSEVSALLPLGGCPPDAFLDVAAQDQRLKIAPGRHVYLAKWGSRRPERI